MTGFIITIALVQKLPIQHCLLYVSQVTEDLNALLSPNSFVQSEHNWKRATKMYHVILIPVWLRSFSPVALFLSISVISACSCQMLIQKNQGNVLSVLIDWPESLCDFDKVFSQLASLLLNCCCKLYFSRFHNTISAI